MSQNCEPSPLGYVAWCDDCGHFWRTTKPDPEPATSIYCVRVHFTRNITGYALYDEHGNRRWMAALFTPRHAVDRAITDTIDMLRIGYMIL